MESQHKRRGLGGLAVLGLVQESGTEQVNFHHVSDVEKCTCSLAATGSSDDP